MEHQDFIESLLTTTYNNRGEDGKLELRDLIEKMRERGLTLTIADDNITPLEIITSEECNQYFKVDHDPENEQIWISLTREGDDKAKDLYQARFQNPTTLFNWAFMGNFEDKIASLADMALPERWEDGDKPFGTLIAYITNTFKRLLHERKGGNQLAIVENGKWAAFNTGLVNKLYDPIYALFAANKRSGMQAWTFYAWCTPGNNRAGQALSRSFDPLPRKASYFTNPRELIYDQNAGVPTLPFEHIIDRLDRLPEFFLREHTPEGFDWSQWDDTSTKEFCDAYRDALNADDYTKLRMKDALELSLRRAVRKVSWNFRMALPVYDAKRRKLMLLIPMSLDQRNIDNVDIALMVEQANISLKYIGHTILTLSMAYKKARMIMRPEADWLSQSLLDDPKHVLHSDEESRKLAIEISEADDLAKAADKSAKEEEELKKSGQTEVSVDDNQKFRYLSQHDDNPLFRPEESLLNTPKVVGKIDVSADQRPDRFMTPEEKEQFRANQQAKAALFEQEEEADVTPEPQPRYREFTFDGQDYDILGTFYEGYGKPYIISNRYKFEARELTDTDLIDGDEVLFDVETEENKWRPGIFRFAVNVRLLDE